MLVHKDRKQSEFQSSKESRGDNFLWFDIRDERRCSLCILYLGNLFLIIFHFQWITDVMFINRSITPTRRSTEVKGEIHLQHSRLYWFTPSSRVRWYFARCDSMTLDFLIWLVRNSFFIPVANRPQKKKTIGTWLAAGQLTKPLGGEQQ